MGQEECRGYVGAIGILTPGENGFVKGVIGHGDGVVEGEKYDLKGKS